MNKLIVVFLVIYAVTAEEICTPDSFFKSECNTCICSKDGKSAFCTYMGCPETKYNSNHIRSIENEPEKVCTPRSLFKERCNTCTCADDGLAFACTRMMCDNEVWNEDGSIKLVKSDIQVCEPFKTFNDYCNTCICSADGLSKACTYVACDTNIYNKDGSLKTAISSLKSDSTCTPGMEFSPDSCNTCICNEYGSNFACTRKLCLSTFMKAYKVEETRKWGPLYRQGDACTPNQSFYSECNHCVCMKNGRGAYCTLMACLS